MTMKTLLITVSEATTAKNLLRGTFWKHLNESREFRIILLCAPEKVDAYRREFGGEGRLVESFSGAPPRPFERTLAFMARNAFATKTVTMNQMRQYVDAGGLVQLLAKRALQFLFGRSRIVHTLLRRGELSVRAHPKVVEIFRRHQPDVVFATNILSSDFDIPVLREALRQGIRTIGMPRGWDNFTAHGLVRIIPNTVLLPDEYARITGVKYQYLGQHRLVTVGFPHHDWFQQKDLIETRASFLKRLGIDPTKRFVLFGAQGDYLIPAEWELAEIFNDQVMSGSLPNDLVMIYRAHPTFESKPEKMTALEYIIYDRGAKYDNSDVRSWEMGREEIAHFVNSIVHSEMVITTGSTTALDGVALGKPAISAAFEKHPINYWLSARRIRHHWTHYMDLLRTGGVARADSPEELVAAINRYLEDPMQDKSGRERLTELFLEPLDGKSGQRIAKEVKNLIAGLVQQRQ